MADPVYVGRQTNILVTGSANLTILMPKQSGNEEADLDPFAFQVRGVLMEGSARCSCQ